MKMSSTMRKGMLDPARKTTKSKKRWSDDNEVKNDNKSNKRRKKNHNNSQILAGMTLAISTLHQHKDEEKASSKLSSSELSYCQVAEIARGCGAKVSGQVHKKVECVLCTRVAIIKATQRVRKAKKKHIPLVDIDWLHKSIKKGQKLPFDSYLLKYPEEEKEEEENDDEEVRQERSEQEYHHDNPAPENDNQTLEDKDIPLSGWSNPVDVGCCCVCHENGTTAGCEWCKNCNVETLNEEKRQSTRQSFEDSNQQVLDHTDVPKFGWTAPVDVGCCCVCHENGTTADCEWCVDCTYQLETE